MKLSIYIAALLFVGGFAPHWVEANQTASTTDEAPQTVEETVREYFADIPVMIDVARCESKFRQFTDSGNVLRGGVGGQMIGVYQFFDRYHLGPASALGFDIETLEGNLDYARYTYEQEGTTPWNSARDCWNVVSSTPDTDVVDVTPSVALLDQELRQKIALLQQIIELLQALITAQQRSA